MKRLLSAFALNNPDERNRAFLLFAYNFLATSIMVMGRIVRDTLFLNKYKGDRLMLSLMYIGVAILVSTATFFYTKRRRCDNLLADRIKAGFLHLHYMSQHFVTGNGARYEHRHTVA